MSEVILATLVHRARKTGKVLEKNQWKYPRSSGRMWAVLLMLKRISCKQSCFQLRNLTYLRVSFIFKNLLYRWDGSEIWPLVLRPTRYGKDTAGKIKLNHQILLDWCWILKHEIYILYYFFNIKFLTVSVFLRIFVTFQINFFFEKCLLRAFGQKSVDQKSIWQKVYLTKSLFDKKSIWPKN